MIFANHHLIVCVCVVQLESDEDLLVPHARAALEKYRHQVSVQGVRFGKQMKTSFFPHVFR